MQKAMKQAQEARAAQEGTKSSEESDENELKMYKGEMLSQKEINRRRLAEARRRDAEKYGEEYKEVTDEDLR